MHSTLCTTLTTVKIVEVSELVENIKFKYLKNKTRISHEIKKILILCLKDNIFRSYHFLETYNIKLV